MGRTLDDLALCDEKANNLGVPVRPSRYATMAGDADRRRIRGIVVTVNDAQKRLRCSVSPLR